MKKTMIYYCPPLFGLAKVVGCITIDRKNREEAISALKRGASKIKQSGRSVCCRYCIMKATTKY